MVNEILVVNDSGLLFVELVAHSVLLLNTFLVRSAKRVFDCVASNDLRCQNQ